LKPFWPQLRCGAACVVCVVCCVCFGVAKHKNLFTGLQGCKGALQEVRTCPGQACVEAADSTIKSVAAEMSKGRANHVVWGDCEKLNSGDMSNSSDLPGFLEKAQMKGLAMLDESSISSEMEGTSHGHLRAANLGGLTTARLEELHPVPDFGDLAKTTEWLKKAGMWSVGSAKHGAGQCRPCHFAHTKDGCKDKEACQFCHLPHTSMSQKRPSKPRRRQCRVLASLVQEACEILNPGEYSDVVEHLGSSSTYMQKVLKKKPKCDSGDDMEQSQPRNIVML